MFKRCAVVFTLFLFAIFSSRVSAQIPIAFIVGGTLTVNGTLITHQTGGDYTFEVTRTDGTSFSPQASTAGIEESGAYIIEIPMYHSTTQPSGAHTGDSAVIHVYRNGQELSVLSPPQGQITIGQEGTVEEINLSAESGVAPPLSPSANAGPDQTVSSGAQVTLDGSASAPATYGGTLTYTWTQTSGTTVTLSNPAVAKPVFTAPQVTTGQEISLVFELRVTDPNTKTATDTVTVKVQGPVVTPSPTANAGQDQNVDSDAQVTLDGSASTPATSGGVLTYTWTQTSGTTVNLSNPAAAKPVFTSPTVSAGQEISLVFVLAVKDPNNKTATDTVTVKVKGVAVNHSPSASAGTAQTVYAGTKVTLSGSASDPDADEILTFVWEQTLGTPVLLSGPRDVRPTFIAPDPGQSGESELTFMLTVTDAGGLWDSDTVTVTVRRKPENHPPLANAGPAQTVYEGDEVILDGSNSTDPDNGENSGIVSWAWQQTDGTAVTISNAGEKQARFTAPSVSASGESLSFELTVTDKGGLSATDTVTVNVLAKNVVSVNHPPIVSAGADQTVNAGDEVTLDGSASTDPEGAADIASYEWKQILGKTVSLSNPGAVRPVFTAPATGNGGIALRFELTVTDKGGLKNAAQVTVNVVSPDNQPPVAHAGSGMTVEEGKEVMLDGSASADPENSIILYIWRQLGGIPVTLSDAKKISPTFTAPDVSRTGGILTFELTVVDSGGLMDSDRVTVTVIYVSRNPGADAGADQSVTAGQPVFLDGSASADPDGWIASYLWSQISGTPVSISDPLIPEPFFTAPDASGQPLIFRLTVVDNEGLQDSDQTLVTVTPAPRPPVANAGADRSADEGSTVVLDGSGSFAHDGVIRSYWWSQLAGPPVNFSESASLKKISFMAPGVSTGDVVLVFQLRVTDSSGLSGTDEIRISVRDFGPGPGDDGSSCFVNSIFFPLFSAD